MTSMEYFSWSVCGLIFLWHFTMWAYFPSEPYYAGFLSFSTIPSALWFIQVPVYETYAECNHFIFLLKISFVGTKWAFIAYMIWFLFDRTRKVCRRWYFDDLIKHFISLTFQVEGYEVSQSYKSGLMEWFYLIAPQVKIPQVFQAGKCILVNSYYITVRQA